MAGDSREAFLERIRANIAASGQHLTLVAGSDSPRFAYTIGLTEAERPELVLAGTTSLGQEEVAEVLNVAADRVRSEPPSVGEVLEVPGIGTFGFGAVDPSWAEQLLLGVYDYYDRDDVAALQLVPGEELRTIDVPDLSVPFSAEREPVWQWLTEPWDLPISADSVAVTNLKALRGEPITEAARWEPDQWEMFVGEGPEVPREEVRVVPLATLLGFDPSLEPVARLDVGKALQREPPGPWEAWGD